MKIYTCIQTTYIYTHLYLNTPKSLSAIQRFDTFCGGAATLGTPAAATHFEALVATTRQSEPLGEARNELGYSDLTTTSA